MDLSTNDRFFIRGCCRYAWHQQGDNVTLGYNQLARVRNIYKGFNETKMVNIEWLDKRHLGGGVRKTWRASEYWKVEVTDPDALIMVPYKLHFENGYKEIYGTRTIFIRARFSLISLFFILKLKVLGRRIRKKTEMKSSQRVLLGTCRSHPESTLSCLAGSINTGAKKRIFEYAFPLCKGYGRQVITCL